MSGEKRRHRSDCFDSLLRLAQAASRGSELERIRTTDDDGFTKSLHRELSLKHNKLPEAYSERALKVAIYLACFDPVLANRLVALQMVAGSLDSAAGKLHPKVIELLVLLVKATYRDAKDMVRLHAYRLLRAAAALVPTDRYFTQGISYCRVHDYLFVLLCDAMNDFDPDVKLEVHRLLLQQCLTKDLLSGFDASSTDRLPSIPRRACGAIVHALEDDREAIRLAALDAIRAHGSDWPFAALAIRFLIDTLNDESDSVRLRAVKVLGHLATMHRLELELEHLQAVLGVLDDRPELHRRAARSLISSLYFPAASEKGCVGKFVACAVFAISRFPAERDEVIGMCALVGANHSDLLLRRLSLYPPPSSPAVGESLRGAVFSEPAIENDTHRVKAVLLLNAYGRLSNADRHSVSLPSFVLKHYPYLFARFEGSLPLLSLSANKP